METKSNGQATTLWSDGAAVGVGSLSPAEIAAWRAHHLKRAQWHFEHCRYHRRQVHRFDPPAICRAIEFIEQHLTESLTVDAVAKYVSLCPQQFRKRFKEATGKTFRQYLTASRVERAKELLLEPGSKVLDVAFDAGFQSLSPFYRAFRKYAGQTAREYRRSLAKV